MFIFFTNNSVICSFPAPEKGYIRPFVATDEIILDSKKLFH